ncbi:MAG: hypothetical protein R2713_22205 [Ilumatobacteraceae bacterium]
MYPWQDLGEHFRNFFVPTLVLTLPIAAVFARLLRGDMVMTLQADFVTLASAKGVSTRAFGCTPCNSAVRSPASVCRSRHRRRRRIVAETFFDLDGWAPCW